MSFSLNECRFMGTLVNSRLVTTSGGHELMEFDVAVDDSYTDKKGNKVERTATIRAAGYGQVVDAIKKIDKGSTIFVTAKATGEFRMGKNGKEYYNAGMRALMVFRTALSGATGGTRQRAPEAPRPTEGGDECPF